MKLVAPDWQVANDLGFLDLPRTPLCTPKRKLLTVVTHTTDCLKSASVIAMRVSAFFTSVCKWIMTPPSVSPPTHIGEDASKTNMSPFRSAHLHVVVRRGGREKRSNWRWVCDKMIQAQRTQVIQYHSSRSNSSTTPSTSHRLTHTLLYIQIHPTAYLLAQQSSRAPNPIPILKPKPSRCIHSMTKTS